MNYAVTFKGSANDRWHRWTVCQHAIDAVTVLDELLDTKHVYGAAVSQTDDDAAPHWRSR